ncbi:MAG TPA: tetratricopeptide repeat protein [Gemmataceae bacterium]|nr:tetratricopeptide repeat protein [Gemmataceae bacterium]
MTPTLNLVERLLALGRNYQEIGRFHDAEDVLGRLATFRELPADAAEETQSRLAELHLRRRRYHRARRCLAAALAHRPDSARYHLLMAKALQADDRGDLQQADEHYRRSLELDAQQVKCRSEAGLLALRLGRTHEGLDRLRQAVDEAPDDAEALRKLVKGLRLAGRSDEARTAIQAGLFRNPRHPRFRRLWQDYQFQQLYCQQRTQGRRKRRALAEPVLLPFRRPEGESKTAPPAVRFDGPAEIAPLHGPCGPRRPAKRRIQ